MAIVSFRRSYSQSMPGAGAWDQLIWLIGKGAGGWFRIGVGSRNVVGRWSVTGVRGHGAPPFREQLVSGRNWEQAFSLGLS